MKAFEEEQNEEKQNKKIIKRKIPFITGGCYRDY